MRRDGDGGGDGRDTTGQGREMCGSMISMIDKELGGVFRPRREGEV